MRHDELQRKAGRIRPGTFASVIRAYQSSPAYLQGLARSTQRLYNDVLRIAEREEALGGLSVTVIRPALVQAFLDGLAETPGRQKIARTALSAVQKWALVRDLLPYPIMTGTYTVPTDGGHEPWSLEHVRLAEVYARPDLARVVTLAVHTGQRGSDIVKMLGRISKSRTAVRALMSFSRKPGAACGCHSRPSCPTPSWGGSDGRRSFSFSSRRARRTLASTYPGTGTKSGTGIRS
jgi:hypothetical protein